MLVFNFHHVEAKARHAERRHITITPAGLKWFIRILRATGHRIVSLRDVLADERAVEKPRQVVLTFDDGYVNNLTEALPVLLAEKCPATVFVLPGRFSGTNEWDQGQLPEHQRDRLMSRAQMADLVRNPYLTLGSHGLLHKNLTALNDVELHEELRESHRLLLEAFGDAYLPVFAYPWGTVDRRVAQWMEATPYRLGFTVETARWHADCPRFLIPRYSVYYRDGNPLILLAKLARHGLL